jgi:hypothetical protein
VTRVAEPDLIPVVAALRAMSQRCYGDDLRQHESALLAFVAELLHGEDRALWRCCEELRIITRRELASTVADRTWAWAGDTLGLPLRSVHRDHPAVDEVERALFPEANAPTHS